MDHASKGKSFLEQCQGLTLCTLVSFVFADESFNLLSKKFADGCGPAGGQHSCFLQSLST